MNPIIQNAYDILVKMVEKSRNYISPEEIRYLTGLNPNDLDDAVEYLVGQGVVEVLRGSGTAPYGFYNARVTPTGRILYYNLKNKMEEKERSTLNKIKVLFLAADPGTSKLKLDDEIREITNKIRDSKYRDSIELVSYWAVRPGDLIQALNEIKPQIVHFSGHGNSKGEIIVKDINGLPKALSTEAIKSLFKTLKDNIKVVVLNSCFSKPQAEAIAELIDCSIGMKTEIGDDAAIVFSSAFYRAIGFGRSIQEAFEQAKTALLLEGIPEENTPVLLVKSGSDPTNMRLLNNNTI
jgi:hypothetical protein